jgi:hypothetical protein
MLLYLQDYISMILNSMLLYLKNYIYLHGRELHVPVLEGIHILA